MAHQRRLARSARFEIVSPQPDVKLVEALTAEGELPRVNLHNLPMGGDCSIFR
jgi:hypothetical protein